MCECKEEKTHESHQSDDAVHCDRAVRHPRNSRLCFAGFSPAAARGTYSTHNTDSHFNRDVHPDRDAGAHRNPSGGCGSGDTNAYSGSARSATGYRTLECFVAGGMGLLPRRLPGFRLCMVPEK